MIYVECLLALVLEKSIQVYTYNGKKLNELPKLYKTIEMKNLVKFIQFAKEAHLTIFYDTYFECYLME